MHLFLWGVVEVPQRSLDLAGDGDEGDAERMDVLAGHHALDAAHQRRKGHFRKADLINDAREAVLVNMPVSSARSSKTCPQSFGSYPAFERMCASLSGEVRLTPVNRLAPVCIACWSPLVTADCYSTKQRLVTACVSAVIGASSWTRAR